MASHTRRIRRGRLRAVAALAMVGALLVGCQPEPTRDASGSIAEEGDLSVFKFRVGDCFADSTGDVVSDVVAVPCSEPHDNEVYYLFDMPDGPWPGDEAIDTAFADRCLPAFEDYVGASYEVSEYYIFPITPTEQSWEQDDREVVCVLYADGAQLTGSVKGSGR